MLETAGKRERRLEKQRKVIKNSCNLRHQKEKQNKSGSLLFGTFSPNRGKIGSCTFPFVCTLLSFFWFHFRFTVKVVDYLKTNHTINLAQPRKNIFFVHCSWKVSLRICLIFKRCRIARTIANTKSYFFLLLSQIL